MNKMNLFSKKNRNETVLFRKNNIRTYLVDGLIAHNSLNFITGPSNIGKTTVVYHFAKCKTDGNDWFGKTIDQGAVMLFDNEMGIYAFDEKMEELGQSNLEEFSYIEDQFIDVKNPTEVSAFYLYIQNEVDKHNLKLVIIDSLSACCGNLDENSNTDMRLFMDFADKLSHICTTFVIHHKGKSLENEFRGASIIKDRSDNFFVMDKLGEIKISKNRSGKMRDTKISFDYQDCDSYVSLVLDEANSDGFQPKKTISESLLLNLEDGMNQTQLFQKMRSNGVSFVDGPTSKLLKNMKTVDIRKGPNNSSIYYHKG
jgi:archaellum biogenesis ATPase FlaH